MPNVIASRRKALLAEPWDFDARFPMPLPEALAAGLMGATEVDLEEIAAIHEELEREALGLLAEFDRIAQDVRRDFDPRTGRAPASEARKVEVRKMADSLAAVRDKALEQVLACYIDAFGLEAGCAFRRYLIATHRDILIYVPICTETPVPEAAGERETEDGRALLPADFEHLMPGGAGAAWPAGRAIWNVEIAGPFDPDRGIAYDPGHPFYYHLAGLPLTSAQIVEAAPPMSRERLLGEDPREPGVAYWRTRLADARRELNATVEMYDRLFRKGPRALSEYDRGIGRREATPVTLWAEMMAGGYRFVASAAATVKGIEQALDAYSGGVERLAEAPVRHEQMPLFG